MGHKIASVGIGFMGGAMARHLHASGCEVVGTDVNEAPVNELKEAGVPATTEPVEALKNAEFIVSSLPNSAAVRSVWLDNGNLLEFVNKGATVIEMSSIDPQTMKDVAQACTEKGVGALDVPVSGGPGEAESGKLVLMIGGPDKTVEQCKPVLDLLGSTHLMTGDVGTAKVVKLVNNVMTMGNVLVASEAFAMGTAAGVDPNKLFDALSQSGGRSHHFLKRFPKALDKQYAPGFKMQLGEKDVALAIDVARSIGQPMPTASLVRDMYMMAMGLGYRDLDIVALLDMFQRMGQEGGFAGPDQNNQDPDASGVRS